MKLCPYCHNLIEINWSYCHFCNKPLVTNLGEEPYESLSIQEELQRFYPVEQNEEDEIYFNVTIQDNEIDKLIQKIDDDLRSKEILGLPIPGSLLLEKSSLYYRKRDISNALKNLELAIINFKEQDDLLHVAITHNEIGLIQEEMGFFDQSIFHFNSSLEILRKLDEKLKIIKVLNNLGNVYFVIKDLEHSYNFYQEALNLSKQQKMEYEEVKTASNLIEILYLLKNFDRIKRILIRNEEFFEKNNDIYGIIRTKIQYGKLYFLSSENYDQAYESLNFALELVNSVNHNISVYLKSKIEWECFFYLGKIYLIWRNLEDAENSLLKSLEAVRTFGIEENINEGIVLEALTEVYLQKSEIDKSIEFYNLSYEIFKRYGDNLKTAEIKLKIAEIYFEFDENLAKAIEAFEEALDLYEDLGYIKEPAVINHKLGDIFLGEGIIETAISHFEKAKEFYREFHDDFNMKLLDEKIKSLKNPNLN